MKIEELADAVRSQERWEPFMAELKKGLRLRRRRKTAGAIFSVGVVLLFAMFFLLFPGKRESRPLLTAAVPSLSDPTFAASSGTIFIARNTVNIRTEVGP